MEVFITYLHYLGIMVLMGSLIAEHLLLRPGLDKFQINRLATTDLFYAVSVLVILITGLLRWFVYGKGSAYYLSNPLFHTKLTLFVILAILSIKPTIRFLKWRKQAKKGVTPNIDDKTVRRLLIYIRLELLIVAIMPLLAVMIARGFRF